MGTGLELHEGCPPREWAALSALHPFLAGDGPAAKLAGGRIEPSACCAPGHPFPPRRLSPEEHLQILVCVRHPCSVIKDFIHPRHPMTTLPFPDARTSRSVTPLRAAYRKRAPRPFTRIMPVIGIGGSPLKGQRKWPVRRLPQDSGKENVSFPETYVSYGKTLFSSRETLVPGCTRFRRSEHAREGGVMLLFETAVEQVFSATALPAARGSVPTGSSANPPAGPRPVSRAARAG